MDGVGIVDNFGLTRKYFMMFLGPSLGAPFMLGKCDHMMYKILDTSDCAALIMSVNNEHINRPFKFKKPAYYDVLLDLPEINLDD